MSARLASKRYKAMLWSAIICPAIFLNACAVQPSQSEIQALPVIQLGDAIPKNGEYILYFPAGKKITTTAEIKGDIFERVASKPLSVALKRDIYSYKNWLSYDKLTWLSDKDVLAVRLELNLPSYYYPHSGNITLQVSEKE